jgi:hypothetical protein
VVAVLAAGALPVVPATPVANTPPAAAPATPRRAACKDGVDNDTDGKTDWPADPQCTSADDTAEKI